MSVLDVDAEPGRQIGPIPVFREEVRLVGDGDEFELAGDEEGAADAPRLFRGGGHADGEGGAGRRDLGALVAEPLDALHGDPGGAGAEVGARLRRVAGVDLEGEQDARLRQVFEGAARDEREDARREREAQAGAHRRAEVEAGGERAEHHDGGHENRKHPRRSPQRLAAVDAAVAALNTEGIPHDARNTRVRTLLAFFGPFAPVEVLVPAARAARARERLEGLTRPGASRG